jgi:hypothetical protein
MPVMVAVGLAVARRYGDDEPELVILHQERHLAVEIDLDPVLLESSLDARVGVEKAPHVRGEHPSGLETVDLREGGTRTRTPRDPNPPAPETGIRRPLKTDHSGSPRERNRLIDASAASPNRDGSADSYAVSTASDVWKASLGS